MITLSSLNKKLVEYKKDIIFEEYQGIQLVINIDLFNNHILWSVRWKQGDYDCCKDFGVYDDEAFKYFMGKVEELTNGG